MHNDRALEWNNAYSLWLAREHFRHGVLLVNGDTVHPGSVQKCVLARAPPDPASPALPDGSSSRSTTSSSLPRRR